MHFAIKPSSPWQSCFQNSERRKRQKKKRPFGQADGSPPSPSQPGEVMWSLPSFFFPSQSDWLSGEVSQSSRTGCTRKAPGSEIQPKAPFCLWASSQLQNPRNQIQSMAWNKSRAVPVGAAFHAWAGLLRWSLKQRSAAASKELAGIGASRNREPADQQPTKLGMTRTGWQRRRREGATVGGGHGGRRLKYGTAA